MTQRDRRALIAGGLAAGLALLLVRGAPAAWRGYTDSRDALQGRAERLAWMREQVAGAGRLEDSAAVVRAAMVRLAPALLTGPSESEAAAALSARLAVAAERVRAGVRQTDVVADSTSAGHARRVSLRTVVESDTRGLFALLGELARSPEVLEVDRLQVAADRAAANDVMRAEVLHLELTVSGWYLPVERKR